MTAPAARRREHPLMEASSRAAIAAARERLERAHPPRHRCAREGEGPADRAGPGHHRPRAARPRRRAVRRRAAARRPARRCAGRCPTRPASRRSGPPWPAGSSAGRCRDAPSTWWRPSRASAGRTRSTSSTPSSTLATEASLDAADARGELDGVEDELFRFGRIVGGDRELGPDPQRPQGVRPRASGAAGPAAVRPGQPGHRAAAAQRAHRAARRHRGERRSSGSPRWPAAVAAGPSPA